MIYILTMSKKPAHLFLICFTQESLICDIQSQKKVDFFNVQ
jgi:hypothetical protein